MIRIGMAYYNVIYVLTSALAINYFSVHHSSEQLLKSHFSVFMRDHCTYGAPFHFTMVLSVVVLRTIMRTNSVSVLE